jgi:signal transduction histidine kinase
MLQSTGNSFLERRLAMPPRAQFMAVFVATVISIVAISYYGFRRLESVADDGDRLHDDLNALQVTSALEEDLRDLSAATPGSEEYTAHLRVFDAHMEELRRLPPNQADREILATFRGLAAKAREENSADMWHAVGQATGEFEQHIIQRSKSWGALRRAHENAKTLLLCGGGVVLLFAAASAFVFVRWQRERRNTQERLRRSDQLAALGTIAASVAHEINNPLATISGCATAVRDRMKRRPDVDPDSLEYLEMIQDESRRCAGILKSLRDLARDGPTAMAQADVAKIVRSVVALIEVDRSAKNVTFAVAGDERLDAICDPDKLKQMMLNLLINARDASDAGGTVTVTAARTLGNAARIEVADGGRGIDPRDLVRIFEPFHTDKTQGLGIGLFLCARIAALHGGTIRAESDGPGTGARFVVEFPTRTPSNVPADAVS